MSCHLQPNQNNQVHDLQPMKLNNLMFTVVGAIALTANAVAGTAAKNPAPPMEPPAEDSLGIAVSVGYDSHLFYHSVPFGENYVHGDLDVNVPLNDSADLNLEASYGNVFDDEVFGTDYQRLVLGANVSTMLGAVEAGVGYRWIHHEGDLSAALDDGHEVGATLATKAGPLNVGVGAYYDFADEGWYFQLGVNSEIKLTDRISLVPGVTIDYGIDYAANYVVDEELLDDGFLSVTPSIALPIKLCENATLTPYIAARLPIDALDDAGEDEQLYGGVTVTVNF